MFLIQNMRIANAYELAAGDDLSEDRGLEVFVIVRVLFQIPQQLIVEGDMGAGARENRGGRWREAGEQEAGSGSRNK